MTDLSLAALQSMSAEETGEVWLALVSFKHADIPETIFGPAGALHFVMNNESITVPSRGNLVFHPLWMDVRIMSSEPDRQAEAVIRVDAVDQILFGALESLQTPPTVDIEYVLASDVDTVVTSNLNLTLQSAKWTLGSLEATLIGLDYLNELVPGVMMSRRNTPNLFL